ncbi:unnamed protein product [Didymodactylos carnosus]|uniref:C2H2-type domain-containing protein n=1 Tax=Didymodactylos carnosus TaxID=1234261 RepID=A0A8S2H0Q6_9BILA|nr:unnamed protein product [Didymodactylos carnosus]CAF3584791.1 unnamed protein product [Didymodactylos carnosus]
MQYKVIIDYGSIVRPAVPGLMGVSTEFVQLHPHNPLYRYVANDPYFHRSSSLFRSSVCCQKHYHIYKYFKRNSSTNSNTNSSSSTPICFRDLIVRFLRTNLPRTAVNNPNQSHWICSDCSRTLLDIEHCTRYIRQQINELKTKLKKSNRLLTSSISVTFQQKLQRTKIKSVGQQQSQINSSTKPKTTADYNKKIENNHSNRNHCNETEDEIEDEEDDEDIEDEIDEDELEDEEESNGYVERPRPLLFNNHVDERLISSLHLSLTPSLSTTATSSSPSHCKTNCNCKEEPIILHEEQQSNILRIETPPPTAGGLVNNNASASSSSTGPARLLTIASAQSNSKTDEIASCTMNLLDETANNSNDDAINNTITNNNQLSSIHLAQMMHDTGSQLTDTTPTVESILTNLPDAFVANIQRNILFKILTDPFAATFAAQYYQQQQRMSVLSPKTSTTSVPISPIVTHNIDLGNAPLPSTSAITTTNTANNLNSVQQVIEQRQGRKRKSRPIKNQKFFDLMDNNTKNLNSNSLQQHRNSTGNISPIDDVHNHQNQIDLFLGEHSTETITSVTPITLDVSATVADNNGEIENKSHKNDTPPQRTAIISATERSQLLQHQTISLNSMMNMTNNKHDKPIELTVKNNNHSSIQQVALSPSKCITTTDVHNLVMKSSSENNVNKFLGFMIPNNEKEHNDDLSDKATNDSSGKFPSTTSSPSLSQRPSKRARPSISGQSTGVSNKSNRLDYTNNSDSGAAFVEPLISTAQIKTEKHRHSLTNESLSPNSNDNNSAANRQQRKLDPRPCAECGKVLFNDKQHLLHCQSHAKNDKQCWICGSLDIDMKKHIATIHGNQKFTNTGFQCQHCDKVFPIFADLDLHLREHSKKKPFECPICSKRFGQQGNLSCHLRIHTGVKPFNCNNCGKAFRHSNSLRRHSRTVHSATRGLTGNPSPLLISSSSADPTTSQNHTISALNRRRSSSSSKNTNILELSHQRLSTGINASLSPPLPADPMSDVETTSSSTGIPSPGVLDSSSSSVLNTNEKSDVVGYTD